jgi:branched-chain amino acid transport system substrate-binding protein
LDTKIRNLLGLFPDKRRAAICTLGLFLLAVSARAEIGVTDTTILIGQSTPVTGSPAARANKIVDGIKLYFAKVNSAGGINGRKLQLISYDDGYEPTRALENSMKLINQDKVFLVFKYYGTPTMKAALGFLDKADVPIISPTTGVEFLRHPIQRNVFLGKAGHFPEAEKLVETLVSKGFKNVGIIFQDDGYGQDGRNGVLKALTKRGLKPTVVAGYQRNATDIAATYETIKKANPKAVILWSVGGPSIEFLTKAAKDNWLPTIFISSPAITDEFALATKSLPLKIFSVAGLPLPEESTAEIAKAFLKDMKAANMSPDPSAFEGYVESALLTEALKRAGKDLTRAGLRKTYETKMSDVDLGGIKVSYSATEHEGLHEVSIVEVTNGKFVTLH